jgi:hypothetical protein
MANNFPSMISREGLLKALTLVPTIIFVLFLTAFSGFLVSHNAFGLHEVVPVKASVANPGPTAACNNGQYLVAPDTCCPVGDNYSEDLCVSQFSNPTQPTILPREIGSYMKIESNPALLSTNQFSNMSFYLNTTDNHVHLKGLLTNLLHETVYGSQTNLFGPLMALLNASGHKSNFGTGLSGSGQLSLMLSFMDNATGQQLKSVNGSIQGPIGPGKTVHFDVDTGYGKAQASQEFPYMKPQV